MPYKRLAHFIFLMVFVFVAVPGFLPQRAGASDDSVVAQVNGVSITKSQLDLAVMQYQNKARKATVTPKEELELLKGMIRRQLILQQNEVAQLRRDETIARQVREFENQLVIARFLETKVGRNLDVTEAEMKEYYQRNLFRFSAQPKVKASHILLRSKEDALAVMSKLQDGKDFAEMARQYSIDLPMALEGGSMGIIEKGKTLPELEKALFFLKEGEVSDIVQTKFGYHILRVDEIMSDRYQSFEEVRGEIRQLLLHQKEAKAFEAMVAELEKGADIKILDQRLLESAP